MAVVIVSDIAAPADRARQTGIVTTVWSLASVLGPVLGGVFTQYTNWRIIFWLSVPICVLCFAVTFTAMRKIHNAQQDLPLDWPGSLLIGGGTACLGHLLYF